MIYNEAKLKGVSEKLVGVVRKVATSQDVIITEGVRTKERQEQLFAQGRTTPGPKVTWTLNSKHITGDAVDVCPYVDGKINWNDTIGFVTLGKAMLSAAKELGVSIRWGYDWDGDGTLMEKGESDGPHFEVI
jgi:hypothetical protein